MPVPVTPEAMDAAGAIRIGRVAGASQRLPFEDTEPDFDLIQPRGMQRQKLEVHPARLQAEPRANFGSSVNGQVVEDNDQSAAGPPATGVAQELQKLAPTTARTDVQQDAPGVHLQASQNGQRAVPPILIFEALGLPRRIGRLGCSRCRTWTCVFSSMQITRVPRSRRMYQRITRRSLRRNSGSGLCSQHCTRCGLSTAACSHRPTVLLLTGRRR